MSSPKGHLPLHKKNPESTLSKLLVIHAVFIYAECFASGSQVMDLEPSLLGGGVRVMGHLHSTADLFFHNRHVEIMMEMCCDKWVLP